MKYIKTPLALLIGAALLTGCNDDTEYVDVQPKEVKIATYNLSFDRSTFEDLVAEMQVEPAKQTELVTAYLDGTIADEDKTMAEKVIQIRNVAAIIQKTDLMFWWWRNSIMMELEKIKSHWKVSRKTTYLSHKALKAPVAKLTLSLLSILMRNLTQPTQA